MGQVKRVPQSAVETSIFKVSSQYPEVHYIFQKLSDTATPWNINKALGKTRPAISMSLRCCTRMILHSMTHFNFYSGVLDPSKERRGPRFPEQLHSTS